MLDNFVKYIQNNLKSYTGTQLGHPDEVHLMLSHAVVNPPSNGYSAGLNFLIWYWREKNIHNELSQSNPCTMVHWHD